MSSSQGDVVPTLTRQEVYGLFRDFVETQWNIYKDVPEYERLMTEREGNQGAIAVQRCFWECLHRDHAEEYEIPDEGNFGDMSQRYYDYLDDIRGREQNSLKITFTLRSVKHWSSLSEQQWADKLLEESRKFFTIVTRKDCFILDTYLPDTMIRDGRKRMNLWCKLEVDVGVQIVLSLLLKPLEEKVESMTRSVANKKKTTKEEEKEELKAKEKELEKWVSLLQKLGGNPFSKKMAELMYTKGVNLFFLESLDRVPRDCIPCENGLLDVKKRTLRPYRAMDLLTRTYNIRWNPDAPKQIAHTFLYQFLSNGNERLAEYIIQSVGAAACGYGAFLRMILILIGQGTDGKSVFDKTIQSILGQYCSPAPDGAILVTAKSTAEAHTTWKSSLHGTHIVIADEAVKNQSQRLNVGYLKSLSSGDLDKYRVCGSPTFLDLVPNCLMVMTSNPFDLKPYVNDTAFMDRAKVAYLTGRYRDNADFIRVTRALETNLAAKEGFFLLMVEGARKFIRNSHRLPPFPMTEGTKNVLNDANRFYLFIKWFGFHEGKRVNEKEERELVSAKSIANLAFKCGFLTKEELGNGNIREAFYFPFMKELGGKDYSSKYNSCKGAHEADAKANGTKGARLGFVRNSQNVCCYVDLCWTREWIEMPPADWDGSDPTEEPTAGETSGTNSDDL